MNDFELKKDKWLKEVAEQCHEFAIKTDLDFYVFQTPIFYNPDLLIIGINPGGDKSYSQLLKDKGYSKRPYDDLGYNENTLVMKPDWEIKNKLKGNDTLRNAFKRVFNKDNNLAILENTIMMNMFYFNTQKEIHINKINIKDEIKNYCIYKTKEFIEISNPKNILFLTSNDKNLKYCSVQNIEVLGNNVKKGLLGERNIHSIPHYGSYSAYSYVNAEKTGKKLSEIFSK